MDQIKLDVESSIDYETFNELVLKTRTLLAELEKSNEEFEAASTRRMEASSTYYDAYTELSTFVQQIIQIPDALQAADVYETKFI